MTRPRTFAIAVLFVAASGCASRREAPTSAGAVTRVVDPSAAYLASARATFARADGESPRDATRTLSTFAAIAEPTELPPSDRAFVRVAIDRELALRALDAGDTAGAVVAIERALSTSESAPRDTARDAALLLVAEEVYRRSGRTDSATWAHREAAILVRPDAGL